MIKVDEIELERGIEPVWMGRHYNRLRALVRWRGRPLGWADVRCGRRYEIPAAELRETLVAQLGRELLPAALGLHDAPRPAEHGAGARTSGAPEEQWPAITVVVCTRDRADLLDGCLRALLALDYPEYEVLVVDNASRTEATGELAARHGVRCVREQRPGLNWARNCGLAAASHALVAFTDDDARPDRLWLRAIARAFAEPEVMAVTGPVVPLELETPAQRYFEFVYGGMSHGFRARRVRRDGASAATLLWASNFGVGANMAFRRELFDRIRPFDPALDVGTPSGGGGDIELLHRTVAGGHTLAYEPGVLVWHIHRRDSGGLRRQLFDNGRGFASYLLTCWRRRTVPRLAIARFWAGWMVGWILRRLVRPESHRRIYVLAELLGAVAGPFYYAASRRHARRIAAGVPRAANR